MIADNLKNFKDYCAAGSILEKGFLFLKDRGSENLSDGKIEIDGEKCFALVQSYTTVKPGDKRWEAHNSYIDIQYVAKGKEIISYAPRNLLAVEEDQTPKADLIFFKGAQGVDLIVGPGDFAVFFPQDGHKPGIAFDKLEPVKKIVVKVKYQ